MSKGRRYSKESKLNVKKVLAVVIAILVIIMFICIIIKVVKSANNKKSEKIIPLAYYTVYTDGKWGVINGSGKTVIEPTYDEMITIPDIEKDVFIVTYNVNYSDGTYNSKAINSKNQQLFTNYDNVEVLDNHDKQNSIYYFSNCLKVEKNGKYGLIDFSGKQLMDCKYDSIDSVPFIQNSLITVKDGKKGLISATGASIIENEYADIYGLTTQYEDGYIVKNDSGEYGVIGTNKKILVPIEYDEIKNVHSGTIYVVKKNNKLSIYDSSTSQAIEINEENVKTADGDNIIVEKSNKYGLINTAGEERIANKYQDLTYAFANYYIAKTDDKYGIIDTNGDTKVDFKYEKLEYRKDADFIEGQIEGNVNSDLIDRNLEVKLSGIISQINLTKGYMKVRIDNEYKYYNFKFEEKKNTELLTENTLYLSKKDDKYGYINKDGIVVVNYIYDDATEQNEYGYVAVKKDGKWGCLDNAGNVIVETSINLDNNSIIDFIGQWHITEDANAGYYTK